MTIEAFIDSFPRAGDTESEIRHLLKGATRAPSTHNSQPWIFSVRGDTLNIYRDGRISLPNSDAKTRYAHVSIGFLLHHISILASWLSMKPVWTLVMQGDHIASVTFTRAVVPTDAPPQVRAVFIRRNRRGVFLPEAIPESVLDEAAHAPSSFIEQPKVSVSTTRERIMRVAELTRSVMFRVYAKPEFRREMSKWITHTGSGRSDGIPGYSLNQPLLVSWILPTLIRFVNIGKVPAKVTHDAIASAAALFGFGSQETPAGWLSVGYAASHAALTLVSHGYDYSVFVASVEYPDTRQAAGEAFNLSEPLQFLFAAGKLPGSVAWMTPRIAIDAKLI